MANNLVLEGKNYDKLVEFGLKKLGKKIDEIDVKVIKKPGFMGIGNKNYVIKLSLKNIDNKIDNKVSDIKLTNDDVVQKKKEINAKDFKFDYRADGVYLKINDIKIYADLINEILRYLERKHIEDYALSNIKENIKNQNIDFFKIAPQQKEVKIDDSIRIEVSSNLMKAYAILLPAIGGEITKAEKLISEVKKSIKFGLKEDILDGLISNRNYNKKILIAEGLEAKNGIDGKVEYLFETTTDLHPTILENGNVDLKHVNLIHNVEDNSIIAKIIPSTAGKDGMTVTGNEIRCVQGQRARYSLGKNVEYNEKNKSVIALKKGQVKLVGDKITVIESYDIPGDVDNSTGHIDFNGSVSIKGSIKTGFNVTATEDIEVQGVIEGSKVSSGQSIIIKRGVHGNNEAILTAEEDVSAKYLMNCTVQAGGSIMAGEVMHSNIEAKGSIQISGKSSVIVGGTTKAKFDIEVGELGSDVETPTVVEVGADPELKAKYDSAKKRIDELYRIIDNNDKSIQILNKQREKGTLSDEKMITLKQLLGKNKKLTEELDELKIQHEDLDQKIEELTGGKIKVNGTVFPGVKIIIGNEIMFVRKALKHCSIYRIGGEIIVGNY